MARPKKRTVDYFPHQCNHGKTMFILEQKYGNDGYAFWFKLLELLGTTEGHFLHLENSADWEFLQAKTRLYGDKCREILDLLARLDAIDRELWESHRVVWSQNFVDGIAPVYRNRGVETPSKPSFYTRKPSDGGVSTPENPQSRVEESRVEESTITDNTNTVQYSTSTPPLPPPTPNGAGEGGGGEKESSSPKTIDELIDEATRYTAEQRAIIREYWDTVRFTRRRGAVAPSIVKTELEYWERFPPDIVLEALNIHLTKYRNKREEYTRGIMRRLQEERRNGGDFNHTAQNRENHGRPGNRARTRTARTSACDYIGGKYGAIFEKERQAVHSTTSGSLDSE